MWSEEVVELTSIENFSEWATQLGTLEIVLDKRCADGLASW